MNTTQASRPIGRYLFHFAWLYTLQAVIVGVVTYLLDMKSNTGASVGITMVSTIFVVHKFFATEGRFMNRSEQLRATIGSLMISLLAPASLMFLAISLQAGGFSQGVGAMLAFLPDLQPITWLAAVVFVALIQGAVLWLGYGWLARKILSKS